MIQNLAADVDKESILFRQANRYYYSRDYEKANTAYKKLFKSKRYGNLAFERYFYSLLNLKKTDEAEKTLQEQKNVISPELFAKLNIYLSLYKGNFKAAENKAKSLLKNQKNKNSFVAIANIFSSFRRYDMVIEIYLTGRKILKNNNLFAFQLAYSYKNNHNYKKALSEIVKYYKQNKNNYYFTKSFILELAKDDSAIINYLENLNISELKSVYVMALIETDNKAKALEEAKKLSLQDLKKVIDFIQNQNPVLAIDFLKIYYDKSKTAPEKIETKLAIAEIYLNRGNLPKAKELLLQIYNDEKIQSRVFNRKTKSNLECRKLLAKITLMENGDLKKAIKYLKEAKKFAFNKKEKTEIDLKILNLVILTSDFKESQKALADFMIDNQKFPQLTFYKYLVYAFDNSKKADSLLVDLIIKMPQSDLTNDALVLNYFLSLTDKNTRKIFIAAFKQKQLYNFSQAHNYLEECYEKSNKEEFLMLSLIWFIQEDSTIPQNYFQIKYKNKFIKNFVNYLSVIDNQKDFKDKAITFLSENPNSIFSPQLRRLLGVLE